MAANKRYPSRDGCFGVTVTPKTKIETDQLRGEIPRSRWVERALVMYNACMKQGKEANGVWGSQATNQTSTPATPTPTTSTEVIAPETNTFLNKGGLGA